MDIISDTGPVIALAKTHHLNLLNLLFDDVYVIRAVFKELMAKTGEDAEEIEWALEEFIIVERSKPATSIEIEAALKGLGSGEKQSIEFAYEKNDASILLMDDKAGRQTAQKLNIPIIGTIGLLLLAKNNGLIENVTELLKNMRKKGYWLSDEIIEIARKKAKE